MSQLHVHNDVHVMMVCQGDNTCNKFYKARVQSVKVFEQDL